MIPKISAKRLKKLNGKLPFSTIPKKPNPRLRKRPRSKGEFARIYGSKKRVLFVKSLPCATCGVMGHSENAHVAPASEKGVGYKAGFEWIVPLCGTYPDAEHGGVWLGCHHMYDRYPWAFRLQYPDFDPEKAAAETEQKWQEHLKETA
jgi:hypothetical protein